MKYKNKSKKKLEKRAKLNKGKRVGYAKGDVTNRAEPIDGPPVRGSGRGTNTGRGEDEANEIPSTTTPAPAPTPAPVVLTPEQIEAAAAAKEKKIADDAEKVRLAAEKAEKLRLAQERETERLRLIEEARVADLTQTEQDQETIAGAEAETAEATEAKKAADIAAKAAELRALKDKEKDDKFLAERKARMNETGERAQDLAAGNIPDTIPTIQTPTKISQEGTVATPNEIAALKMGIVTDANKATKEATAGAVEQATKKDSEGNDVPDLEVATTITTDQKAKAIKTKEFDFDASKIEEEKISTLGDKEVVAAASGTVSTKVAESLAAAAGLDTTPTVTAAEVQVVPGALQTRVVGTISPEAKAQAATVSGTTLAKLTRAKKQLRTAGLSEEDITELGSNPEALEDRLTDFTEAERGLIEGLPEEALVSNQMDTLLKGIEEGNIPTWASPAVASVEAMLAKRGMSVSTVGRDSLLNAIITSALPLAQGNAQAIQASVGQQRSIEATNALKDAEMAQQTAIVNAQSVFQMDMAQFSADQQMAVNNSKFFQTASLTNASNAQQAAVQNAVLMSQANLAEADQNTKFGIQNAQAFLQMDLSNLSNQQQSNVLQSQLNQQRLLSNASATNAARQFNATSENQTNQFMGNLDASIAQFNAQQTNAISQFNAQQKNAAEARRVQNNFEASKLDAQLSTQVSQFNAQQEFNRDQFNVKNATAIAQSNLAWRRQSNTADTAAINAVNQQNAQNAYGLSVAAQNFLWQELRDEADFTFKRWDNDEQRKTSLLVAALGNEAGVNRKDSWASNLTAITDLADGWLDDD